MEVQKTKQWTTIVIFITELVLGFIIIIIIAITGIDDVFGVRSSIKYD